ncbi:MAG: beta strand repeat-containing protein [Pirellulales bacterium]
MFAPAANAQNRFWITTSGGAFSNNANWSTTAGGVGGASFPVAANTANFTTNQTYTVSYSTDITNTGLVVANGTVTFDLNGNDYILTAASGTLIGAGGSSTTPLTGKLTIKDGLLGVDSAGDVVSIGSAGFSSGELKITTGGRLGNGTLDPNLFVGQLANGTLTLEDNGRADVGSLILGQEDGVSGTVTVNGVNAVLDASQAATIGFNGTGTLTVQSGGLMNVAGNIRLGNALGANGTATITGLSSRWIQGGTLTVGEAGDGSMSVQSAAQVDTASNVLIGNSDTGFGTAVVTGLDSTWNMGGTLLVGGSGLGNFAVSTAARATTTGATTIGSLAGGEGNVAIAGTGSRWTTAAVTVGAAGSANISVNSGGVVNTTGAVTLASLATGVGKATVTGSGSAWSISGGMSVAAAGAGALTVESDASLTVGTVLSIGDPAGTQNGTLNFTGGTITAGSFTRAASSTLNWTNGTMFINGGTFNNGGAALTLNGSGLNDVPALRLGSGAQSSAANTPSVTIGGNRQGGLVVSGGSSFQTTTASLGAQDGGTGSLRVEGANSTFVATGGMGVGGTTTAAGGLGTITIGPGGTVNSGGTLKLWGGGSIVMSGGTMRFSTLEANGGKFTFNSGTIEVQQNFVANDAALDAIVGSTRVLGFGRKIDTLANTFNLQSDLSVTGGATAGNVLLVNSGVVARFESAGTGTFAAGVTNPAGARIFVTDGTLSAGTTFANGGELHLAGAVATVNAAAMSNSGLVEGSGRINSPITNNSPGQIRVQSGQRLEILGASGTTINNGLVDVDGGTIEFGRPVTNSSASPSTGMIAAREATLRFNGSLSNNGALTFAAGVSDVFGDVTNMNNLNTPGRIIVTGGAQANFFDDVVNNGSIQVSASGTLKSTAVFLGSLSGNGVTGTGQVFIEGDARPGFSPGTMAFGGDVSFGPLSTLNIELAGTTPGTQYDRVTVAQTASIDGDLNVSLLGGYRPAIGTSFQVVAATGGLTGTFDSESLPELAGGASWSVDYSANAVTLEVGGVLGDFNHDGRVDAADFSVWRDKFGTNTLAADASGNGSVDQADYNIWKANFGQVAAAGDGSLGPAAAVPEPSSIALVSLVVSTAMVAAPGRRVSRCNIAR